MKKIMMTLLLVISLILVGKVYAATTYSDVVISNIYVDGKEVESVPSKSAGYYFEKVECNNNVTGEWNREDWSLKLNNVREGATCKVYFTSKKENNGESGGNSSSEASKKYNNPNTGAFLNITLIIMAIALAIVVIIKEIRRRKFFRI